jgi:hypothetical protein
MSNQIKELALPATLVVLLMVYPALVVADTINPMPITAVYSAGEWIVDKLTDKPKPSLLTPERQAKFDRWSKEDWIKDDPYACMWDKDWITKYKNGTCK